MDENVGENMSENVNENVGENVVRPKKMYQLLEKYVHDLPRLTLVYFILIDLFIILGKILTPPYFCTGSINVYKARLVTRDH